MNPKESESFWKRNMEEDIQKQTKPQGNGLNSLIRLVPTQQSLNHLPSPPNSNFNGLQNQSDMKPNVQTPFQWNDELQQKFFKMHEEYGNRWSIISAKMGNLGDNCIKNKFYSTIRRGFRKINKYITNIKRRQSSAHLSCNKLLKPEFLVKLTAVADRNFEEKFEAKDTAINLSQQIQNRLVQISRKNHEYDVRDKTMDFSFEQNLLKQIQQFNRNCKRRKGKRRHKQRDKEDEKDLDCEQIPILINNNVEDIQEQSSNQQLSPYNQIPTQSRIISDQDHQRNDQYPPQENMHQSDIFFKEEQPNKTPYNSYFLEPTPVGNGNSFLMTWENFNKANYMRKSNSSIGSPFCFSNGKAGNELSPFLKQIPVTNTKRKDSNCLFDSTTIRNSIDDAEFVPVTYDKSKSHDIRSITRKSTDLGKSFNLDKTKLKEHQLRHQ